MLVDFRLSLSAHLYKSLFQFSVTTTLIPNFQESHHWCIAKGGGWESAILNQRNRKKKPTPRFLTWTLAGGSRLSALLQHFMWVKSAPHIARAWCPCKLTVFWDSEKRPPQKAGPTEESTEAHVRAPRGGTKLFCFVSFFFCTTQGFGEGKLKLSIFLFLKKIHF